jgi:hypothetical protein
MEDLKMVKNSNIKFIGVNTGLYSKYFKERPGYFVEYLRYMHVIDNVK